MDKLDLPPLPDPDVLEVHTISDPTGGERYLPETVRAYGEACALAARPAWVPCAKRMPDDFQHVMVIRAGYERGHSYYFAYRARGRWIKNDINCTPLEGITHWMRLPEPPKE